MVLMAVRDGVAADAVLVLDEVGDVGDDEIDARHVLRGEDGADVDDDDVVLVFVDGHIFADLTQAAQGNDAQLRSAILLFSCHKIPP